MIKIFLPLGLLDRDLEDDLDLERDLDFDLDLEDLDDLEVDLLPPELDDL